MFCFFINKRVIIIVNIFIGIYRYTGNHDVLTKQIIINRNKIDLRLFSSDILLNVDNLIIVGDFIHTDTDSDALNAALNAFLDSIGFAKKKIFKYKDPPTVVIILCTLF